MDNNEIIDYLNKLKKIEEDLGSGDDSSPELFAEVNNILNLINESVTTDKSNPHTNIVSGVMVKVKKLDPSAVIPKYSKIGDAGMDLTVTSIIDNMSAQVRYGFGIAMEIPKGYVGLIFPRSSINKYELTLSNSVGVIDSGYRGEIQAIFNKTNGLDSLKYKPGDRAAQILILPYPEVFMTEVLELSDSERNKGGFGSTGS